MRLGQGAAEHGEILGEDEDRPAFDMTPAGDHPVAGDLRFGHAEIGAAVFDEHVELLEGILVEEDPDALARRQLAAPMLLGDPLRAAPLPRLLAPLFQLAQDVAHRSPLNCDGS